MQTSPLLLTIPETLETERLVLRVPRDGEGEKLCEALKEGYEEGIRWLNWPQTVPSSEEVEEQCRKHRAEFILRETMRYLIFEKCTGELVGRCAFPGFQAVWAIPQFGISYFIRKSQRSKGYATEAAYALTKLAFKVLGARKVEIYCDAENKGSWRVPEKLNFELEFTQRGGWPRADGKLCELRTYALFDEKKLPQAHVTWEGVVF